MPPLTKEKALAEFSDAVWECFRADCTMNEVVEEFNHAAPAAEVEAEERRELAEEERREDEIDKEDRYQ